MVFSCGTDPFHTAAYRLEIMLQGSVSIKIFNTLSVIIPWLINKCSALAKRLEFFNWKLVECDENRNIQAMDLMSALIQVNISSFYLYR